MSREIVVIGAGPAGLAAAHEAVVAGSPVTVIEASDAFGGLARTIAFEGCRFDVGPHRFFTRNQEVIDLYDRTVGSDIVTVRRLTRILHNGRFFDYPLTPVNAMLGLGLGGSLAIGASYVAARAAVAAGRVPGDSFEDWVVDRFGRRLYQRFFKGYTEKVWGIPCREISSEWAAQRIKGLDLATAIRHALLGGRRGAIKSLVDEFHYPRLGAGQAYEKMAAAISRGGGRFLMQSAVTRLVHSEGTVRAAVVNGSRDVPVDDCHWLVSAPLTDLVAMLHPAAPTDVLAAAAALRYRSHVCVNLVVEGRPFPDNWIYVHDDSVSAARISNYRNFSAAMAASDDVSPITVEYFCFPGDGIDAASDAGLISLATTELARLGLIAAGAVRAGFVVRSAKAYPVIERGHEAHVERIRRWLSGFRNLIPIGRAGMFKYNNQDHAMMTGMLATRTALGRGRFDPWAVNIDAEYHEAGPSMAPTPPPA